jgi:hypothetical protein
VNAGLRLCLLLILGCSGSRKQTKEDAAGAGGGNAGSALGSTASGSNQQKVDDNAVAGGDEDHPGDEGEPSTSQTLAADAVAGGPPTAQVGSPRDPVVVITVKLPVPPVAMFSTSTCDIAGNVQKRALTTTRLVNGAVVEVQDVMASDVATADTEWRSRVLISKCGISPATMATSGDILITNMLASAVNVRLVAPSLAEHSEVAKQKVIQTLGFPVSGHSALLSGLSDGVYTVMAGAGIAGERKGTVAESAAWVVVTKRLATTTDADGNAFIALPVGKHRLTAWFPPVAGGHGSWASGEVYVKPGQDNRVTMELSDAASASKKGRP